MLRKSALEEAVMSGASQAKLRSPLSGIAVVAAVAILAGAAGSAKAQAQNGSPGPLANSCGVPPASSSAAGGGGAGGQRLPVFPAGQYPVKLPAASLLGARNDLPNPYGPGVC